MYEAGGRYIAATAVVVLFFFVMPLLVESPGNIQNVFPVAWGQSTNSGEQSSVPVREDAEVASGEEQEAAQEEKQRI